MHRPHKRALAALTFGALGLGVGAASTAQAQEATEPAPAPASAVDKLVGRAVLPADTFWPGPTSGRQLAPVSNGRTAPFENKQPVQGFSGVLDNGDGTFTVLVDNGFGGLENSADARLRLYRIRPKLETARGGDGKVEVLSTIELRDPDRKVPFTITETFTAERFLTGADFDIESVQRDRDGSLWIGDEFGPYILHFSADGRLLDAPYALPDRERGGVVRAPANPTVEEASAVRIMNAVRHHARLHGATFAPVVSPDATLLADQNPATFVDSREAPPAGSGLAQASSEIFNVASLQSAGYTVVPYTVNDKARMLELIKLGVNGLISDRPDLLLEAAREADKNNDGTPGDLLTADGLIDRTKFDAQGHRGARNLRPENTLPAFEAALDQLVTTLETDVGLSADGVPVLDHDPRIEAAKCRRQGEAAYTSDDQVLVSSLTAAQIQTEFVCDKLLADRPLQSNDRALSPIAVAFAEARGLADAYVKPTLEDLFAFVDFYARYYREGEGASIEGASLRALNAERVRFNIETKINPRKEFAALTSTPEAFAQAVGSRIVAAGLTARADIQSFDFRSLLKVQETFPSIRTVCLFGDFPIFADPSIEGSDDGTNLQDEQGQNTPWLAGLIWPYRSTFRGAPARAGSSGGFEGMAIDVVKRKLYPLLEQPLAGDTSRTLLVSEFDLTTRRYLDTQWRYPLDARGAAIGDFTLYGDGRGLIIERDNTTGDLNGFKRVYQVRLPEGGGLIEKTLAVDLLNIANPSKIGGEGRPGDVGLGERFAFPFVTIESVVVLSPWHIAILNDNNYPGSIGRHVGEQQPDDDEFIIVRLDRPLLGVRVPTTLYNFLHYYWLR